MESQAITLSGIAERLSDYLMTSEKSALVDSEAEIAELKEKLSRSQQALKVADGMIANREKTISQRNKQIGDLRGRVKQEKMWHEAHHEDNKEDYPPLSDAEMLNS